MKLNRAFRLFNFCISALQALKSFLRQDIVLVKKISEDEPEDSQAVA
jgi:hypothetical protein